MNTPKEKLALLSELVRQHELYWSELAQHHPTSLMRTFLNSRWDPFYRDWIAQLPHIEYIGKWDPQTQQLFINHAAQQLSYLRELARYNYISTPDIGSAGPTAEAVAGELDIVHDASGNVTITHYPDGGPHSQHVAVGGPHHGGGGGGFHGGGFRRFGGGSGGWWGWGYPYYTTPGCYYDAWGRYVCPPVAPVAPVAYAPVAPVAYAAPVAAPPTADAGGDDSDAAVSGWFDSLKDAVLTVTGTKLTNQFIHDNHLEGIVKVAATAVGTYYGGPAGGAAAGALSGPVMSLGVTDKSGDAAKQAAAQVIAQHGPQAAAIGKAAVDKVAAAYHAQGIATQAAQGDPNAQAQMQNLHAAAQSGNGGAQDLLGMLGKLASSYMGGGGGGTAGTMRDPSYQIDPNAIEMDPGDAPAQSAGWFLPVAALGAGAAGVIWGPRGYRWLRNKLDHHAQPVPAHS